MTTYILDGIWGSHSRWESLRGRVEVVIGPCRIWRYDNSGKSSLEREGRALREELHRVDGPINVIGYSMGGLVIRESLREPHALPVRRAVFLHCPHRGSLAAHAFGLPACLEMRPGSEFLERLDRAPWEIPTLATWCALDAVVVPGQSAQWKKAAKVLRSHVPAHAWPVVSPAIHAEVVRFLEDGGDVRA